MKQHKSFKATKKPIEIDAIIWDGSIHSTLECLRFMGQDVDIKSGSASESFYDYHSACVINGLTVKTLEDGDDNRAKHVASVGDYIIKGVEGEFYPCKPNIFKATYNFD